MAKQVAAPGTASAFALATLTQYPDREMRIADLVDHGGGSHNKPNMAKALESLVGAGLVVKAKDGREAWFALADR